MGKIVEAIVRGPENYFDGSLHPPGSIVEVDEDLVSSKDTIKKTVRVKLAQPVVGEGGKVVRFAEEEIETRTRFRPLGDAPVAAPGASTAEIATGEIARLNVTDFLKGGVDEIEETISSGKVDAHLAVIEQAEVGSKNRKGVKEAVKDRRAALGR